MRVLDSHLHLWDPEVLTYAWLEGPLAGRFGGGELERARIVDASEETAVFVQAGAREDESLDEVRWVAGQAGSSGWSGSWRACDWTAARTRPCTWRNSSEPLVVGVRHLLQDEPDGTALSTAFVTGAREVAAKGWTFDACVRHSQLPDVARLAGAIPELRIVLDHLGKPAVGTASAPLAPPSEWERDLAELARHPLTFCKISGLPAEAGGEWSAEQLIPFLDVAADLFGPERMMWGSDWPVSTVSGAGYGSSSRARWFDTVAAWAHSRGLDQTALFHDTAAAFYSL